ncbi:L-xylulose reductase-like [Mercenaria mercenaria]|uniref:L-xylulose reductase-like n=1 Tax=Mercenaria mercenaria TaxID=6596 RepID=UPI00234EE5A4|nr:L-xylulose reductase-like [Mercenaria mercenaria]
MEVPKDYLDKIVGANLFGTINAIQIIGSKMIAAKRPGSIVNVSSLVSLQAIPEYLPYTVTKCGVDMVTKQFALELGSRNIRVNSINPTLVLTENIKNFLASGDTRDKTFIERTPLQRAAEVREIVNPILYLLSDYSSMVSGTTNVIDGGLMSSIWLKW